MITQIVRCILLIFLFFFPSTAIYANSFPQVQVLRVVDGDTLVVSPDERVRLIGVDTPETVHPAKGVQPYGKEASDFTRKALEGKTVWLEFDVQPRDRYQRVLAYVWTEEPNTDRIREGMFNARLLLEGYAQIMTIPPNVAYTERFLGFEREAREKNCGLWALRAPVEEIKEGYVANRNSRVFHKVSCGSIARMNQKNALMFEDREEAVKQGYKPCGNCKP